MSNKITYWIVAVLIISTCMLFVQSHGIYKDYIFEGDQESYFKSAQLLYESFAAHPFRTFGYALFLGLPEFLEINAPYGYWPIVINIGFLIGILLVVYRISIITGLKLLNPLGFGLILSLGFIRGMSFALTETGFAFFIILATYKLYQVLLWNKNRDVFYFFFFIGFASLFRPGLYIFTILTIPVYLIYTVIKKNFESRKIIYIILGLFFTLGVQSLLMKKTFNTYRLTYIDDITWYRYGGALATSIDQNNCISNSCFREEQLKRDRLIDTMSNDEMSSIAKADRKDIIKNKTAAFIKMLKVNISTNLLSGSVEASDNIWLNRWTVFNNVFLSIVPFVMYLVFLIMPVLRKRLRVEMHLTLIFILMIVAYTVITSGISAYQGDRFHIAFYPISLLLICILSVNVIQLMRDRQLLKNL